MNRAQKETLVRDLKDKFSKARVAIFTDYKGLGATDADLLRKKVREGGGKCHVIKNNLIRLALTDSAGDDKVKAMVDGLAGPTMVAFGYEDASQIAKAVKDFTEDHEVIQIKDSLMEKDFVTAKEIEALASLPNKEVLLAMLLGVLNGPVRNFVGVLAAVPRSLVQVLSQIEKKKQEESK